MTFFGLPHVLQLDRNLLPSDNAEKACFESVPNVDISFMFMGFRTLHMSRRWLSEFHDNPDEAVNRLWKLPSC